MVKTEAIQDQDCKQRQRRSENLTTNNVNDALSTTQTTSTATKIITTPAHTLVPQYEGERTHEDEWGQPNLQIAPRNNWLELRLQTRRGDMIRQ